MIAAGTAIVAATTAAMGAMGGCGAAETTTPGAAPEPTGSPATKLFDVAYADASHMQRLDLYLPETTTGAAPLVIWVHGGGWRVGDKRSVTASFNPSAPPPPTPSSCDQVAEVQAPDVAALNAKGYAVAAINYRLERDPVVAVRDAKAAVRFLRANADRYRLDPDRFAAWGDSAGGYTVIMLGVTSGQQTAFDDPTLGNPDVPATVQAVVDWFGPTDASHMPGNLGPAESPYPYIAAGRSIPPFAIAHGDADCVVPVQQSQRLADALTKAGVPATLNILPGAAHEDPAFMRTLMAPTFAFLDRALRQ